MSTVNANGATFYYERRGEGPPLLCITGATGDAGHFSGLAEALSDEYTVLTYDRRGNSRSPRPAGWTAAPIAEQADDAAALLVALDLAPATAFGHSSGAVILTDLAIRRPDVLSGAIFYEPPYVAATSQPDAVNAGLTALVEGGLARGGPSAAVEDFLRYACGDAAFATFTPELLDRCRANGEVALGMEMPELMSYQPDMAALKHTAVPKAVIAGLENRAPDAPMHWIYEASQWFAGQLGVPILETPGAHAPQATHLNELVATLRTVLQRMMVHSRAAAQPVSPV